MNDKRFTYSRSRVYGWCVCTTESGAMTLRMSPAVSYFLPLRLMKVASLAKALLC